MGTDCRKTKIAAKGSRVQITGTSHQYLPLHRERKSSKLVLRAVLRRLVFFMLFSRLTPVLRLLKLDVSNRRENDLPMY
jgi:hypothetical protein